MRVGAVIAVAMGVNGNKTTDGVVRRVDEISGFQTPLTIVRQFAEKLLGLINAAHGRACDDGLRLFDACTFQGNKRSEQRTP